MTITEAKTEPARNDVLVKKLAQRTEEGRVTPHQDSTLGPMFGPELGRLRSYCVNYEPLPTMRYPGVIYIPDPESITLRFSGMAPSSLLGCDCESSWRVPFPYSSETLCFTGRVTEVSSVGRFRDDHYEVVAHLADGSLEVK